MMSMELALKNKYLSDFYNMDLAEDMQEILVEYYMSAFKMNVTDNPDNLTLEVGGFDYDYENQKELELDKHTVNKMFAEYKRELTNENV